MHTKTGSHLLARLTPHELFFAGTTLMIHDGERGNEQLRGQIKALCRIILKAQRYAESDPEVSLAQARKSAEAICRLVFAAEIGEPKATITLDELVRKLKEARILPARVVVPLGTIQAYGNYGSHAQSDLGEIEPDFVAPCLAALTQVIGWYFEVYLRMELPAELTRSVPSAEKVPMAQLPRTSEIRPEGSVTAEELQRAEESGQAPIPASHESRRQRGVVKWFNDAKGFGFITSDAGDDVFVHFSSLQGSGFRTLVEGCRVEFDLLAGPKGALAGNVIAV